MHPTTTIVVQHIDQDAIARLAERLKLDGYTVVMVAKSYLSPLHLHKLSDEDIKHLIQVLQYYTADKCEQSFRVDRSYTLHGLAVVVSGIETVKFRPRQLPSTYG